MKLSIAFVALLSSTLGFTGDGDASSDYVDRALEISLKIVGGNPTNGQEFPFFVQGDVVS